MQGVSPVFAPWLAGFPRRVLAEPLGLPLKLAEERARPERLSQARPLQAMAPELPVGPPWLWCWTVATGPVPAPNLIPMAA